ncbi:MAG: choice-of-anchor D domain-containing protein, partial [Candidatus Latescibacteria bacterium]|nr:choice-of-anchor D domain-containing protein [Candidatus Latescibacterota bacterium]
MHVTGAPDLEVSDALLAYGQVFIGGTSSKTVVVTNAGTDVLNITSIAASHPNYSVDAASMVLAPATSQNLVVSFAPTSTGAADGTLTFTSDDPDEPSLVVDLTGEGILPPIISVTPLSFEADLFTGETSTQTMTISNTGASNLEFEIDAVEIEAMGATVTQSISIPRSTGDFPRGTHAPSLRAAPSSGGASAPSTSSASPMAAIGSAFATEIGFGQATRFNLATPELLDFIGPAPAWIWAGDFGADDYAYAYAVDEFNQFMQIDTTSGAQTILGTITPFGGEIWTGMAFDPTDGMMYATSTDVSASSFYAIDVTVPSATRIGSVGFPGLIALAIDDQGVAFSYDIVTDEMLTIDKTTGIGTVLGSLGFDANFGQGMGFDAESGQLYLAAFNNETFQGELRVADRTTGATAPVGVLGATQPGGTAQLGFLALPGLGGAQWLIADPDAGVVPPGTSMDVAVTFDAEGLYGGDYNANLVIANNDPLNPEVVASAHLHVTGAPDIQVTPLALDYGPVFIGGVSNQIVVVKNVGTDLLTVTSIASDHGDYTADVANVALAPTASQAVVVSYAPTSTGVSAATLTIASDDPDEVSIGVALTGEGRLPPIIAVNPTSFTEDLFTGETAAHTLTISNTGASDLEFAIDIEDLTAGAVASRAVLLRGTPWRDKTLRGGGAVGVNAEGADSRTSQTRKAVLPTTNVVAAEDAAILVIQDTDAWGIDMATFIFDNFAITATVINSTQIAATDFDPFDLVITVGDEGFSYYNAVSSNVSKFEDYVAGGGVVQYQLATQGDDVSIVGGVDVLYGDFDSFNDVVAPDHPIVAGLPPVLEGNAANHTTISGLPGDALVITETSFSGTPTTVEYEFGQGSVIATGMTWEFLYNFGYEAGAMLGNAVAYSLSIAGVKWIQVEPSDGVVAPGNAMDVAVLFDAAGLYGGDYAANLLVANNDPLNPLVTVPASLHVTGAPDIAVEDTLLTFGPVFVGGNKKMTVVVENDGTDVLNVSSIVSSHPDYSVDVSMFSLAPEGSQNVVVTYAPTAAAPSAGTLTITSDDPDEGVIVIAMQGEGLEPPVISVTPLSFESDLFTGETETHTMTISNSGGNNLEFDISVDEIDDVNATVTQSISIPRSSGDFPRGTHAPSLRAAPNSGQSSRPGDPEALAAIGSAFSLEIGFGQATRFSLGTPEVLDFVGSAPFWIWAGDFGGDDYAYAYAVDEINQFAQMDTTSGAQTILGTITPFGFETWTGMAFDPTDGLMYATSTDIFASSFYVIDVTVPSATRIGSIGFPGIIAVAIDDDGAAWAYDIVTDELVSIDKTTGAGTVVGSLGFDANFGQGMGFDAESGQLYLAAFNNFTFQAELRVADRTTGATAVVGVLGANQPGGTVQLGFLALPGLGGARWLMADPTQGVVPPGTSMDVAVTFDAEGLYGGDYNANPVIENNDP